MQIMITLISVIDIVVNYIQHDMIFMCEMTRVVQLKYLCYYWNEYLTGNNMLSSSIFRLYL